MLFQADLIRVLGEPHVQAVLIYLIFMGVGTLLAVIRPRIRPGSTTDGVWKKYPLYILLNIAFLSAAWLPQAWHSLVLLLAAIGAGASWEVARALGLTRRTRTGLVLLTVVMILAADWLSWANLLKCWLAILLLASAASALTGTRDDLGSRFVSIGGCIVYLPVCLASIVWLSHADGSGFYVVFLYLVIATSDAFGQFTGQIFGRRPLAPRISPAKTLEGAIGGLLFAALLGTSLSPIMHWSFLRGGLTGLTIGLAGLIGDLSESSWKRTLGLKDFSTGLGAQGGFLDRFDALIFAAPVFYLLLGL